MKRNALPGHRRGRGHFAAWVSSVLVLCLLAAIVPSMRASAQPPDERVEVEQQPSAPTSSPWVSDDMRDELAENGSLNVSVTYSNATGADQATMQLSAEFDERAITGVPLRSLPATEFSVESLEALEALAKDPSITSLVVPPVRGSLAQTPDALRGAQLRTTVESGLMHDQGFDGTGVTVALIDSGIEFSHPDLGPQVVHQHCLQTFIDSTCPNGQVTQSGDGSALDENGHGSLMASVIASSGVQTPRGVAPGASLEIIRITDSAAVDLRDVLLGLDYVLDQRPDVGIIVLSLGSASAFESCGPDLWPAFSAAITALTERGVFVTASTGNSGQQTRQTFPACLDNVYSVAALNVNGDALAGQSNVGATTDIAAPGSGLAIHTSPTLITGSSASNAFAAGCAALAVQSGRTALAEIESWLANAQRTVTRTSGGPLPTLQCAPYCFDAAATVIVGLGETPTAGDDVIVGTVEDDTISAGLGDDRVCAGAGDDLIYGGQGNDELDGGAGHDRLWGNWDDDLIIGGSGNDTLHGNGGNDTLQGRFGDDRLFGYTGDDSLSGGAGNDRLHGNRDDDELNGDSGDDIIYGYGGDDQIDGGIGLDTCRGNTGRNTLQRC